MKNILIGFLMATCMFLMIGATEKPSILETPPEELIKQLMGINNSKIGRYQGFADKDYKYMIDTQTGELYEGTFEKGEITWKRNSPETNWIQEK